MSIILYSRIHGDRLARSDPAIFRAATFHPVRATCKSSLTATRTSASSLVCLTNVVVTNAALETATQHAMSGNGGK